MQGDSAGSNPRLCLKTKVLIRIYNNSNNFIRMTPYNIPRLFCLGHEGKKA